MKTCTKCGETKDPSEFRKRARGKDGLNSRCCACSILEQSTPSARAKQAAYRNDPVNKEKRKAYDASLEQIERKRAFEARPEVKAARAVYAQRPETKLLKKANAQTESRRQKYMAYESSERGKAVRAAYNASPKARAMRTAYRKANLAKYRVYQENRRAREAAAGGQFSLDIIPKLFAIQKGVCPCCRQPLGDNYHLDHIIPIALGGASTDDNAQLLRKSCNHQKHSRHPVDFMQSRGFLL